MKKPNTFSEVPKEWKIVRIEDVIEDYQNGYAFSAKKYAKSGLPIVSMSSISLDGRFQFSYDKCKFWDESKKEDLKSFLLKKGDVIIAMTDVTPDKNLIGRMALVTINDTFLLNQRVGLFRLKKDVICNKFLAYIGNSSSWINYCQNISSQGAQANIGTKDIRRSYIPLPPLPEQQKIADILRTVDEKIAVIDQQIIATEELKKGLMQRLLTKGIGHSEFKDSPLGKIPKSWEVEKIDKLGEVISGGTPNSNEPSYWSNDIKWVTPTDITKLKGRKLINDTERYISKKGLNNSSAKIIPKNSLLICTRATVGDCAINLTDMATNQGFKNFVPFENQSVDFYYYLITSLKSKLISLSSGSTFLELSTKAFRSISVPRPSTKEQYEIAEILNTVDEKLQTQKDKKQEYQQLKTGLMQKLLTGKIRVNNLIEA